MNLIVNRKLDRIEKQVIYELTLKKRQSRKSHMSDKQLAARQQLARELMQERRNPIEESYACNTITTTDSMTTDDQSLDEQPSTGSFGTVASQTSVQIGSPGSGCSFSRSDSSYSGSSEDSGTQMMGDESGQADIQARKKEANIKFNKTRLEHLNSELERRLHQYEYLVAQEKALLGAYNMMLFTNQGVNNFHLYDALSTPSRRLKTYQLQQKSNAQRNSAASTDSNSGSTSTTKAVQTTRPQLNSSASTVSNLNTLHMLPPLAGPRRSASSFALMTINQGQTIE